MISYLNEKINFNTVLILITALGLLLVGFFHEYDVVVQDPGNDRDPLSDRVTERVSPASIRVLLDRSTDGSVQLVRAFQGPGRYTGLVLQSNPNQQPFIGWTDGQYILWGGLFDSRGQNLSHQARSRYLPETMNGSNRSENLDSNQDRHPQSDGDQRLASSADPPPKQYSVRDVWNLLEGTTYIAYPNEGSKPLYVFYDPRCSHCHKIFEDIHRNRSFFASRNVTVKWIPIALLNPRSKSIQDGMNQVLNGVDGLVNGMRGKPIDTRSDSTVRQKIMAQTLLVGHSGQKIATPTLVYRTDEGIQMLEGRPSLEQLKQITSTVIGRGSSS